MRTIVWHHHHFLRQGLRHNPLIFDCLWLAINGYLCQQVQNFKHFRVDDSHSYKLMPLLTISVIDIYHQNAFTKVGIGIPIGIQISVRFALFCMVVRVNKRFQFSCVYSNLWYSNLMIFINLYVNVDSHIGSKFQFILLFFLWFSRSQAFLVSEVMWFV